MLESERANEMSPHDTILYEVDSVSEPLPGRKSEQPRRRRVTQITLGAVVSLAFLWLAFRGVNWRDAWEMVRQANPWLLAASLGTVMLSTVIRADRWRLMFWPRYPALRLRNFVSVFLIGQVINAVIPARAGEVARALLIGASERVSRALALWTAVLEKVLDAACLLAFIFALSFLVPLPAWLQRSGWILTMALGVVCVAVGLAVVWHEQVARWIKWADEHVAPLRRLPLHRLLSSVVESLGLVRQPQAFLGLALWSVAAFLSAAATNWLTARALGIDLSFTASLLLISVLQVSAVVPIPTSPGRVGVFHYLVVITLAIFGVPRDLALSYGLVLHVMTYLPMIVGGPLCLWRESQDWHTLAQAIKGVTMRRDQ